MIPKFKLSLQDMTIREYRRGFKLMRRYAICIRWRSMLDPKIHSTKVMTSGDDIHSALIC